MKENFRKLLAAILTAMMIFSCMAVGTFTASAESSLTLTQPTFTDEDKAWYDDHVNDTEFTISTRGELAYFMELGKTPVTFKDRTIYLGADIEWNDGEASATGFTAGEDGVIYQWTPYASTAVGATGFNSNIGRWFQGTIDGQGHTISGLCLSGTSYQAFICGGASVTIKNLNLDNMYVEALGTGNVHSAALIARITNEINISNVHVNVNINASGKVVGGLIGVQTAYNAKGVTFTDCTVKGNITGSTTASESLGGFVGANNGKATVPTTFTNCVSYMNITGKSALAGYVGRCCASTTFTNCSYLGSITTAASLMSYTGAFGYLVRDSYGGTTDALANLTESSGTAQITLTDCYFQGSTCPYAMSILVARPWFHVSSSYGSETPAEFGYDSENFSTSNKTNSESLTALCKSFALYNGDTDMISIGYVQMTKPADGKYDLRMIATLNMNGVAESAVEEIGFEVANMYAPGTKQTVVCNTVYDEIVSNYGLTTVTASELGADYIAAVVVTGISTGSLKGLIARPYIKTEGKIYYGAWMTGAVIDGNLCNSYSTTTSNTFPSAG